MQKVKRNAQFEKTVQEAVALGLGKNSESKGPFPIPEPFSTLNAFLGDEKREGVIDRLVYPATGETITVISEKIARS